VFAIDSAVYCMLYTSPLLGFGFGEIFFHVMLKRRLIRFDRQKIVRLFLADACDNLGLCVYRINGHNTSFEGKLYFHCLARRCKRFLESKIGMRIKENKEEKLLGYKNKFP
jgi:hypothetical protein